MGSFTRAASFVALVAIVACRSAQSPAPAPAPTKTAAIHRTATSPGPLAAGHAGVDDPAGCISWHVGNTTAVDANKCLACHRDLAMRTAAGKGLHASAIVRGKPCEAGHGDHRGRGFDLTWWPSLHGGRDGFDHQLTGWPLVGVHAAESCSECHTKKDPQ